MDCPKCFSINHIKRGFVGSRQRYMCKDCGYLYTVLERGKPMVMKKQALQLYLEGLGLRGIGRFLGVSAVSVMNWIRIFGEKEAIQVKPDTPAPIVELDELHTYIGSKKTTFGFGQQLTGSEKGLSASRLDAGALKQAASCMTR